MKLKKIAELIWDMYSQGKDGMNTNVVFLVQHMEELHTYTVESVEEDDGEVIIKLEYEGIR